MKKFIAPLGAAALLLVGGPAAAAQLITNGGFEAGGTDWTFTGAASGSFFLYGPGLVYGPFAGTSNANFGAVGGLYDEISQTLATEAGQTYTVSFELAQSSTGLANSFEAEWNGSPFYLVTDVSQHGYDLLTFGLKATSSSTTISFFGYDTPGDGYFELDNVSVTGAIPEPAAWALMLVGVGGLGAALRSKRGKALAPA